MEEPHAMAIPVKITGSPDTVVMSVAIIDPDSQHRRERAE
jgi:hypothetical protein